MSTTLPEGARLLHIGPAKTGTTSLQSAFHHNREAAEAQGVHYAGKESQARNAAAAVALRKRIPGHSRGLEAWPELVAEVRTCNARRVVISSETFARCGPKGIADVIEGFGADRTHVVITMRPLVDMLASSWQQFVQTGTQASWDAWLDDMLHREDTFSGPQPQFWNKTRFDRLVTRWGEHVGTDHVTVISLAAEPRDFVLRTFESLTGLSVGTLVPDPAHANASLGIGATEVLRQFNRRFFASADDVDRRDLQAGVIEFGAVRHLRNHPEAIALDTPIEVPRWAADRATELVTEMNTRIRASGANVIGDLDALTVPSRSPADSVQTPTEVSNELAAELLLGMLESSYALGRKAGRREQRQAVKARRPPERMPERQDPAESATTQPTGRELMDGVETKTLLSYTADRVRRRVRRRLGRLMTGSGGRR